MKAYFLICARNESPIWDTASGNFENEDDEAFSSFGFRFLILIVVAFLPERDGTYDSFTGRLGDVR